MFVMALLALVCSVGLRGGRAASRSEETSEESLEMSSVGFEH